MLAYDDWPTIKNAIQKRVGAEPGIRVVDIKIKNLGDPKSPEGEFIKIGVEVLIDSHWEAFSVTELPKEFQHIHLLNQIDEMIESFKAARLNGWKKGEISDVKNPTLNRLPGTGLRGHWPKDLKSNV